MEEGRSTLSVSGLLPWQSYFLAFVAGIFAFRYSGAALSALSVLVIADTALRGWNARLPITVFLLFAAFGYGYCTQQYPNQPEIPAWVEKRSPVVLHGVIDDAIPQANNRLRLLLRDVYCDVDGEQALLPGRVVLNWREPDYEPIPGQSMEARVRLIPVRNFGNPGGWDYEVYWNRQSVFWRSWPIGRHPVLKWGDRPAGVLKESKTTLRHLVGSLLRKTQGGAMVLALVTGDKSRLASETVEATRSAGLAHTLALSGLHVGFVAIMGLGIALGLGWLFPPVLLHIPRPKLAVLFAAPLVLVYAWLGQPSQSLTRAAIMFGFWGILLLRGQGRVLMDGLFFALAVIVVFHPLSVFDLSLQMSALAVAGIGMLYPIVRPVFQFGHSRKARFLGWMCGLLALSLCANVALLPLVSWTFASWSPNFLFNILWLPALGFIVMPLGVLGVCLALLPGGDVIGGPLLNGAAGTMDGLLTLLHWAEAEGLTPVFSVLRPLWPEILGVLLLVSVTGIALANRRVCLGLASLGFLLMVWPHASVMIDDTRNKVSVTLVDVGLGQAVVISAPGGKRWLVDGGGGSRTFDMGEAVVAPSLLLGRPPRLDGVFMSHPDADHSHGLPFILSRFQVGPFYTNGMLPRGLTGRRMKVVLAEEDIQPAVLYAGEVVSLADGLVLEVLHPDVDFVDSHANEHSLVLRLVRNGRGLAILPGDVEKDGIAAVLSRQTALTADVLVLPHHGSRTSYSPDFYAAIAPMAAFCSNGYLNRYGFPSSNVVQGVGVPVYTTSEKGMVQAVWPLDASLFIQLFSW